MRWGVSNDTVAYKKLRIHSPPPHGDGLFVFWEEWFEIAKRIRFLFWLVVVESIDGGVRRDDAIS